MNDINPEHNAKRLARLAATQALYQIALTHEKAEVIIREFQDNPQSLVQDIDAKHGDEKVDYALFALVVHGAQKSADDLDDMILGAFTSQAKAERLEPLLRAILRAGIYELHNHGKIPAGVIINDYVDVAHGFFDAKEPGLVNAILDKIAKGLRQ